MSVDTASALNIIPLEFARSFIHSFARSINSFPSSIGNTGTYTCRTQAQWNQVANDAAGLGMVAIRITGFDCNALDMAAQACAQANIALLAGIFIPGTVAASIVDINNQVQDFRAAVAKYGQGRFVALTIGNEVNDSVDNIMAKVFDVRGYLNSIGITVPVSTVDTWVRIRDNPALCGADFVGANAHAFYDGSPSSNANNFMVNAVIPSLTRACPGKTIRITESGWPSRGPSNGNAVASINDELIALQGLNCGIKAHLIHYSKFLFHFQQAQNVIMYAFEYDDQLWKANDNERSFGMWVKIQGFANSC
ncbi:glycoside hydrolase superfamily [Mycena floridula]|nr:glycoside hydrolase superfamily [Mycena floridula]